MEPKYLNDWGDKQDILSNFEITEEELDGANVLLASYECYFYEGDAFVLLEKDGVLYEVNGSHCSCYGLEKQWNLEPTNVDSLRHRLEKGRLGAWGSHKFADELREVLDQLTEED